MPSSLTIQNKDVRILEFVSRFTDAIQNQPSRTDYPSHQTSESGSVPQSKEGFRLIPQAHKQVSQSLVFDLFIHRQQVVSKEERFRLQKCETSQMTYQIKGNFV